MKEKLDYKSIVLSGAFGGLVYAIIMSIFYQFFNDDKGFSFIKFLIDFSIFGLLIAGIIWWSMKKNNKDKK